MTSSVGIVRSEPRDRRSIFLRSMVDATIEVCRILQGITLGSESEPFSFNPARIQNVEIGSYVILDGSAKCSYLGIFGDKASFSQMAGRMLNVEPTAVTPIGLSNATNEALNVIAGVCKRKLPREHSAKMIVGYPSFLTGADCFKYLSDVNWLRCQSLIGPRVALYIIVAVPEG
jgi:hypothetical protein